MQRSFFTASALLISSTFLLTAMAQQTTPSQTTPPAKPSQSTTAKPHHATTPAKPKPAAKKPLVLTTQKDKVSYGIGMNIGKSLHRDEVDIDPDIVLQGLKDALAGGKMLLTDDEVRATMMSLQEDVRKKQQAKRAALLETNKKEGEAFLAANSKKDGVVTLPSGLQYKILTEGTGAKPTASDTVVCNYRGTLIDNTEFDSSYKRGQPATFAVGQVIKGWTEALQLMPAGSKWQLFIPADLAYGERGQGPVLGPNATLIFEVELISIQAKTEPAAPPASPATTPTTPPTPPQSR